jgi:hypothetical protein
MYTIYWEHGDDVYPSIDWADNGVIIVGWWLGKAIELLQGKPQTRFSFMEGPYAVNVKVAEGLVSIRPRGQRRAWIVGIRTFIGELAGVGVKIAEDLEDLGIATEHSKGLRRVVKEIEELAKQVS